MKSILWLRNSYVFCEIFLQTRIQKISTALWKVKLLFVLLRLLSLLQVPRRLLGGILGSLVLFRQHLGLHAKIRVSCFRML